MKYYVMKISNGDLQLEQGEVTEHGTLDAAMAKWHQVCAAYRAEQSVKVGYVVLINNEFTIIQRERIEHAQES